MSKKSIVVKSELLIYTIITIIMAVALVGGFIGYILFIVSLILLCLIFIYKSINKLDITANILLPVILSVFQNIYLGILSPYLDSNSIQISIVINFIYAIFMIIILFITKGNNVIKDDMWKKNILRASIILVGYSIITIVISRPSILAAFASFRNIISIFLFLLIGLMASKYCNKNYLFNIILIIGVIVIIIGFLDVKSNGEFWLNLNITELWSKKGITLQHSGLPTNFFSSETINGERIRRMASTFADPVNLGSFLVVIFFGAWFKRKKYVLVLVLLAMILTVSKGALLGILIFIVVYSYYNFSRVLFFCSCSFSIVCGLSYLFYAYITASNSVFLHISGFFSAFKGLAENPLGTGIGSAGTLVRQFASTHNNEITESGIGMIIGQLGIIGLLIFCYLFFILYKEILRVNDRREKVLLLSLLFSIISNICFNEVALSPNTCAIYFIIIGLYLGNKEKKGEINGYDKYKR